MARLYANENAPLDLVTHLRELGHEVLTSLEAGNANSRVPDPLVLEFARSNSMAVLTGNRRDFHKLHRDGIEHCGIITYTVDSDFRGLAERIAHALREPSIRGRWLVRVTRAGYDIELDTA